MRQFMTGEFVFHGSARRGLTTLDPVPPRDAGVDPRNKEIAVYATGDVHAAIAFSVTRGLNGVWSLASSPVTARYPAAFEVRLRENVGSLYVLRREAFTWDGSQFKSFGPVLPVAEIRVTIDDFVALGGVLEFVADGAEAP